MQPEKEQAAASTEDVQPMPKGMWGHRVPSNYYPPAWERLTDYNIAQRVQGATSRLERARAQVERFQNPQTPRQKGALTSSSRRLREAQREWERITNYQALRERRKQAPDAEQSLLRSEAADDDDWLEGVTLPEKAAPLPEEPARVKFPGHFAAADGDGSRYFETAQEAQSFVEQQGLTSFGYTASDKLHYPVHKIDGQWWVRGLSSHGMPPEARAELPVQEDDKPLAVAQKEIERTALANIELRHRVRVRGEWKGFQLSWGGGGMPTGKPLIEQQQGVEDAGDFAFIADPELQRRAIELMADNMHMPGGSGMYRLGVRHTNSHLEDLVVEQMWANVAAKQAPDAEQQADALFSRLDTTPEEGTHMENAEENKRIEMALWQAAERGQTETIRRLIENGADVNAADEDGWSPLIFAARWGHTDTTRLLIEHGADVNAADEDGWTPLMFAAREGHTDTARVLIENGADVNPASETGWTPMMLVARRGHTDAARLLIEHGANVNAVANDGWSPLMFAAYGGHTNTVRLLIDNGADVNATDEDEETPLMFAAREGHTDTARVLIENGADVNAADTYGRTVLMMATRNGHTDTARTLIENGADVNAADENDRTALMLATGNGYTDTARLLIKHGTDVNAADQYGWTALMYTARWGRTDAARLLIEHGADVNITSKDGQTALTLAAEHGHDDISRLIGESTQDANTAAEDDDVSMLMNAAQNGNTATVRQLIENGADVNAADRFGRTALMNAAVIGDIDTARLLIEHGANVDTADEGFNWTALMYAAWNGQTDTARLLIESGADVNTVDEDGDTPLIAAARQGHADAARLLIENGADVNAANDGTGWTPLTYAAQRGHTDIAHLLIEHGADVNTTSEDGWTPLMFAALRGHTDTTRLLIEHGANVNAASEMGWTPLMYAARWGRIDTARLLIEHGADINITSKDGKTALSLATEHGHDDIIRLIGESTQDANTAAEDDDVSMLMNAAQEGNTATVRQLIEQGVDVNAIHRIGITPLMEACAGGHTDTARLLIESGANVNAVDDDDETALMYAAQEGQTDTARLLIEHSASVNDANEDGWSPLMFAARWGHTDTTRLLIEHGADVNAASSLGWTSLMTATNEGHTYIARLLIERGADVNAADSFGRTALMYAAQEGYPDIARQLIEHGADVNAANKDGWTPLMLAAARNTDIARLLIEHGANVNAANEDGWTALMFAAREGHTDTARVLIEHGADVNAASKTGWTSLMNAARYGHIDPARLLIKHGADINITSKDGQTALMVAAEYGHNDIARLIEGKPYINPHDEWIANRLRMYRTQPDDSIRTGHGPMWHEIKLDEWMSGRVRVVPAINVAAADDPVRFVAVKEGEYPVDEVFWCVQIGGDPTPYGAEIHQEANVGAFASRLDAEDRAHRAYVIDAYATLDPQEQAQKFARLLEFEDPENYRRRVMRQNIEDLGIPVSNSDFTEVTVYLRPIRAEDPEILRFLEDEGNVWSFRANSDGDRYYLNPDWDGIARVRGFMLDEQGNHRAAESHETPDFYHVDAGGYYLQESYIPDWLRDDPDNPAWEAPVPHLRSIQFTGEDGLKQAEELAQRLSVMDVLATPDPEEMRKKFDRLANEENARRNGISLSHTDQVYADFLRDLRASNDSDTTAVLDDKFHLPGGDWDNTVTVEETKYQNVYKVCVGMFRREVAVFSPVQDKNRCECVTYSSDDPFSGEELRFELHDTPWNSAVRLANRLRAIDAYATLSAPLQSEKFNYLAQRYNPDQWAAMLRYTEQATDKQEPNHKRERVIGEMFLGDAAAYEKSLETYMDGCAAFAEESAEWLGLDPYRFYSVNMWNGHWEESGDNASGSVDCRWAFHREREEILREAEASYLDEALLQLYLANNEEYDQDQLARMREGFTGVDEKVWLDRQQQAHTPQDAPQPEATDENDDEEGYDGEIYILNGTAYVWEESALVGGLWNDEQGNHLDAGIIWRSLHTISWCQHEHGRLNKKFILNELQEDAEEESQAGESDAYASSLQAIDLIRDAQIAWHPGWNGLNREQRLDILRAATEGTMEAETMQESTKLPFRALPNELAKRVVANIKASVLAEHDAMAATNTEEKTIQNADNPEDAPQPTEDANEEAQTGKEENEMAQEPTQNADKIGLFAHLPREYWPHIINAEEREYSSAYSDGSTFIVVDTADGDQFHFDDDDDRAEDGTYDLAKIAEQLRHELKDVVAQRDQAQPATEDADGELPHPDGQIVVLSGDAYRWDNINDLWLDEQGNFLDRNTVTWRVVQAVGVLVSKPGEIDKDAIIDVLQGDTEEERDDLLTQAHDEIGETEEAARAFKAWNDALTEGDAYTPKNHQKISEAQDAYYAARKESTARPEVQQRWQELQADESTEYGITIQAIEVIRSAQIAYHPGWNGLNREQRLDILRAATEGTMEAETMQESTKLPFRAIPNELAKRVVTHIKADVLGRDVYAEAADLYNFDQQESDDDWLEGVTLPEKAAPLPEKPPQMPYNWNGGELEVQASVTLTSRDGKEHVVPAANLGVEPEFWAVYARLKDGTAEWVRDFNTQHEAQRFADQQPLNQVRRIGEFNLPDGGYRGSMIEFATTDAQREGVTRLFYNTTGQPFDEVDGYKIKQVDFVEGQWWVRGQLTPKQSTPPTAADMPVAELQAQVERHALRNIEVRQQQQGSKPAKKSSSTPFWQEKEDADHRNKKWANDDLREFDLITTPELRARAAAVMLENRERYPVYRTMLEYGSNKTVPRLQELAATLTQHPAPTPQEADDHAQVRFSYSRPTAMSDEEYQQLWIDTLSEAAGAPQHAMSDEEYQRLWIKTLSEAAARPQHNESQGEPRPSTTQGVTEMKKPKTEETNAEQIAAPKKPVMVIASKRPDGKFYYPAKLFDAVDKNGDKYMNGYITVDGSKKLPVAVYMHTNKETGEKFGVVSTPPADGNKKWVEIGTINAINHYSDPEKAKAGNYPPICFDSVAMNLKPHPDCPAIKEKQALYMRVQRWVGEDKERHRDLGFNSDMKERPAFQPKEDAPAPAVEDKDTQKQRASAASRMAA